MKRHASDARPAAVLLIDLDHFKSINDRFGHAIGDRVLQVLADEAKSNLRACDMVGRLGGEEFAALLTMRRGKERWRSPNASAHPLRKPPAMWTADPLVQP
jgi:diguanylate cyclase (GGDEF)-like protein